jgi:hypothetical protein
LCVGVGHEAEGLDVAVGIARPVALEVEDVAVDTQQVGGALLAAFAGGVFVVGAESMMVLMPCSSTTDWRAVVVSSPDR